MAEEIRCPECGREAFDESVDPGYRGGMCMGTGSPECREEIESMDSTGTYWRARATREAQLADALAERLRLVLDSYRPVECVDMDGMGEERPTGEWMCCACQECGESTEAIEHADGCDWKLDTEALAQHAAARRGTP